MRLRLMRSQWGGEPGHLLFIGDLTAEPALIPCEGGTLHRLTPDEITGKPTAPSIRAMMEHYIPNPDDLRLHIGNVTFDPFGVNRTHRPADTFAP